MNLLYDKKDGSYFCVSCGTTSRYCVGLCKYPIRYLICAGRGATAAVHGGAGLAVEEAVQHDAAAGTVAADEAVDLQTRRQTNVNK
jgi:hypothetical protein